LNPGISAKKVCTDLECELSREITVLTRADLYTVVGISNTAAVSTTDVRRRKMLTIQRRI
jgi:hypothetical protein